MTIVPTTPARARLLHTKDDNNRRFIRTAFVTYCILTFSACGAANSAAESAAVNTDSLTADTSAAAPASTAVVGATIDTVSSEDFTQIVDAPGIIVARVGRSASLSAPMATRISAVQVTPGSRVRAGDPLVTFDAVAFDAMTTSADAALHAATLASQRAERLVSAGVSPRKDAEAASAELAAAQSTAANAHRLQELSVLRSPINGVVTQVNAILGANADLGQTLVEIADVRALDVQLVLSPSEAVGIVRGQTVQFRERAAPGNSTLAAGRVTEISASVDSATRGVLVRVSIDTQQRPLRLAENVYGRVRTATIHDALVIPDNALIPNGDGFHVFVVDASGRAHVQLVTVGGRRDHHVLITDGLHVGDRIVTSGAFGVDDGAMIAPMKALR